MKNKDIFMIIGIVVLIIILYRNSEFFSTLNLSKGEILKQYTSRPESGIPSTIEPWWNEQPSKIASTRVLINLSDNQYKFESRVSSVIETNHGCTKDNSNLFEGMVSKSQEICEKYGPITNLQLINTDNDGCKHYSFDYTGISNVRQCYMCGPGGDICCNDPSYDTQRTLTTSYVWNGTDCSAQVQSAEEGCWRSCNSPFTPSSVPDAGGLLITTTLPDLNQDYGCFQELTLNKNGQLINKIYSNGIKSSSILDEESGINISYSMDSGSMSEIRCTHFINQYELIFPSDFVNVDIIFINQSYTSGDNINMTVKIVNNQPLDLIANITLNYQSSTFGGITGSYDNKVQQISPGDNLIVFQIPSSIITERLTITPYLKVSLPVSNIYGVNYDPGSGIRNIEYSSPIKIADKTFPSAIISILNNTITVINNTQYVNDTRYITQTAVNQTVYSNQTITNTVKIEPTFFERYGIALIFIILSVVIVFVPWGKLKK